MLRIRTTLLVLLSLAAAFLSVSAFADNDWPMWRYDAAHTASSPHPLPSQLHLQWVRELPPPQPAWPEHQYKLQFDLSYEPVVMGKSIFVPSMVTDSVTAYDTDSGAQKWRFYCDGPVRFAPVAWEGSVFFASDDGYLYCLSAETGGLKWKFRGGPSDRKVLGNGRLISTWPARGAPVLYDGVIYFAAGIWPFMGTFIHALDARTGDVVWSNSSTGPIFVRQPHNDPAFSGVAPQGYMAAADDKLIVTGGRARPAGFDRKTGELLYFNHADNSQGKFRGGYDVAIWRKWFFNFDVMYNLSDGGAMATVSAPVLSQDAVIGLHKDGDLMAYVPSGSAKAIGVWKSPIEPALQSIHLQAGNRIYASDDKGLIAAVDIPSEGAQADISWRYQLPERVFTALAADEKLFVVTTAGSIYCFGAEETSPVHQELQETQLPAPDPAVADKIARIIAKLSDLGGYCVLLGADGDALTQLLSQSQYHIIVIDSDAGKVASLRAELTSAGAYGTRAAVILGDINSVQLPPYFASLILARDLGQESLATTESALSRIFQSLRPYGGAAVVPLKTPPDRTWKRDRWIRRGLRGQVVRALNAAELQEASVSHKGGLLRLIRKGPLPGSADWTHQYGDIANTVCSKDKLVKAPLGLLWFGDDAEFGDVLPRHGHGPPEQVVGGRLFIQGLDSFSARDVYTGRTLWKKQLEGLNTFGVYYDKTFVDDFRDTTYNQVHIAGANARGTNFVATADDVYIIQERRCAVLDAGTGDVRTTLTIPGSVPDEPAQWGYIGVYGDNLIAGAEFVEFSKMIGADRGWLRWTRYADKIASRQLVVMDRASGKAIWSRPARCGFIHNAIAVGDNKVFCIDEMPPFTPKLSGPSSPRLLALDIRDGEVVWETDQDVFGGWLGYSVEHDVLIQGDWPDGDDMGPWKNYDRIIAYQGETGKVLWDKEIKYNGPYILHGDTIITQRKQGETARAYSLLTGEEKMRDHPLTGESVPWEYMRLKGCNTAIGSEHLLTFRSSAAGFYDLENDGGTGNLGGFKSGCTSNLVVADGVLNAPDYTQTCTCSYQNQTSLALIHVPDADFWTFNTVYESKRAVKRVGINFGAPGDRKDEGGTLWLDYPSLGGVSPDLPVRIAPEEVDWVRLDSSEIGSGGHKWVAASAVKGVREIVVTVDEEGIYDGTYTVRLWFCEFEHDGVGDRIFDVVIQGKKVLEKFDIFAEAGAKSGIMKEYGAFRVDKDIVIVLEAVAGETVICGVEIVADE